ncbi:MAG: hypothetical protein C0442_08835 [Chlorobiaceae bacterium]|nr:hypothetical protein [Chlorobiaceae bacterium]
MFKTIYKFILIATVSIFIGCGHDHEQNAGHGEDAHAHAGITATYWTAATEMFMEHPVLIAGQEAEFLIHLTDIKNFKPVVEGKLTIDFVNDEGVKVSVTLEQPKRDGIYTPKIKFDTPGFYNMTMVLTGNQVSDRIIVEDIKVYENESVAPHLHEETTTNISFLKEQQWKIDFNVEPVVKREMRKSVIVTGEINVKPEYFAKVVSPIAGIVLNKNNTNLKSIGSFVKKGELLLNVSPSADASVNIQRIKNDFLLSKSEYERVQNLFEKKAVSQRRLDEAKFDYEAKLASYNAMLDQIKFTESGFAIFSPIDGFIEKINFNLGAQISSGQELFSIVNPNRLVLQVDVPSSKSSAAYESKDASFKVEGNDTYFTISHLNGRKLSVATSLNEANRTVPVYFEFNNPQSKIKVGMYAEVFLKIGDVVNHISIPQSAIVNEDGIQTVYVQLEGEAFEKRIVKTGIVDAGFVQVLEGLNEGERVVTVGAYQVRLATLSVDSAIGHGHVH